MDFIYIKVKGITQVFELFERVENVKTKVHYKYNERAK